jgi:hypothetical protein
MKSFSKTISAFLEVTPLDELELEPKVRNYLEGVRTKQRQNQTMKSSGSTQSING